MRKIYDALDKFDLIIFGKPVYFYGLQGMKIFIDRLRPYIANKKFMDKKDILVAPSEEGQSALIHGITFKMSFIILD